MATFYAILTNQFKYKYPTIFSASSCKIIAEYQKVMKLTYFLISILILI